MVTGIIGKKVGMTQLFAPDGTVQPATVLKAGPCVVVAGEDGGDATATRPCSSGSSRRSRRKENKPTAGPLQEGRRAADARAPRGAG